MSDSKISTVNGKPRLFIDGECADSAAYITYFTEREKYADFRAAGYTLYSVCAYFTSLPINEQSGFTPARIGCFDTEGAPDYREIDADMHDLLAKVPDAKVFLRVYVSMPRWWVESHPTEVCPTQDTPCGRELLYSDAFLSDGAELLRAFIRHIRSSDYAPAVIGYQISGGGTQEWFHHDRMGALCENALPYFRRYMEQNHPGVAADALPPRYKHGEPASGMTDFFLEFDNRTVAHTVEHFCRVAKECVEFRQIVGAFYGYSVEVTEPDTGTHALADLIDSPYVDFIDSPVSYTGDRALGIDWVSMCAENSLENHGKLYFVEADVRTHLSLYPDECRPGHFRQPYRHAIWKGGPTEELAVCQIRKAFAKLLTHSGAFWWFDMWGGWYDCDALMREMAHYRALLHTAPLGEEIPRGKAAFFLDERGARRLGGADTLRAKLIELGNLGVPYDLYVTEDFGKVYRDYAAVAFLPGTDPADAAKKAELCRAAHVTVADVSKPIAAVREDLMCAGVGIYADSSDVVYAGNGYVAIHAATAGTKTLHLPALCEWESVCAPTFTHRGRTCTFDMSLYETKIFRVKPQDDAR